MSEAPKLVLIERWDCGRHLHLHATESAALACIERRAAGQRRRDDAVAKRLRSRPGNQYRERDRVIAHRYARGEKQRDLAVEFGLCPGRVGMIIRLFNRDESNRMERLNRYAVQDSEMYADDQYFKFCLLAIIEAPATPAARVTPES